MATSPQSRFASQVDETGSPVNLGLLARMEHRNVQEQEQLEAWDHDERRTLRGRVFLWWRSYSIEFRELAMYFWFLLLYMAVVFGPAGTTLDRYQLKADVTANVHPGFSAVASVGGWYDYVETTLLPNLYAAEWDTEAPAAGGAAAALFTADGVNRRVGAVRLRLVRVLDRPGDLPAAYAGDVEHLYPALDYEANDATGAYAVAGWPEALAWASGPELGHRGATYCPGTGISYPPSGYVVDLPKGLANATAAFQALKVGVRVV